MRLRHVAGCFGGHPGTLRQIGNFKQDAKLTIDTPSSQAETASGAIWKRRWELNEAARKPRRIDRTRVERRRMALPLPVRLLLSDAALRLVVRRRRLPGTFALQAK